MLFAQNNTSSNSTTPALSASSLPITIVALGDSLTEGYGINKEMAYPALVEAMLKKEGFVVKIINSGASSSTSSSAKGRIQWLLKQKPNFIFLALGANDGLRGISPSVTKKNLIEAIQLAKKHKIQVWLAGMKMPPNYGASFTKEFENVFSEVARTENVPLLPFLLDGVAGNPELNLTDKIHPNEKGHEILARHVAHFFKTQLRAK